MMTRASTHSYPYAKWEHPPGHLFYCVLTLTFHYLPTYLTCLSIHLSIIRPSTLPVPHPNRLFSVCNVMSQRGRGVACRL